MDKDEARARLIALAETTPKGEQRDALIMGANALIDDVKNIWLDEHNKQVRLETIYEVIQKADCSHTDCWDCAFGEAEICKLQQLYGTVKRTISKME